MYRPQSLFSTPAELLIPTYEKSHGISVKHYPSPGNGELVFVSFKTYGGTQSRGEGLSNDLYTVEDTAILETWYRPEIASNCRFVINGKPYEITGEPENIELRNQFLRMKVRHVKGGV